MTKFLPSTSSNKENTPESSQSSSFPNNPIEKQKMQSSRKRRRPSSAPTESPSKNKSMQTNVTVLTFDTTQQSHNLSISLAAKPKILHSNPDFFSGEDAYLVQNCGNKMLLGVFDGVGGYKKRGIDPAYYSHAFGKYAGKIFKQGKGQLDIREILRGAHNRTIDNNVQGGSTAVLAEVSHKEEDESRVVRVVSLGDSSALLFRLHSDKGSHSDNTILNSASPSGFKLVHRSLLQQHNANTPFQLVHVDSSVRLGDSPDDAVFTQWSAKPGDVMILCTDGVTDNLRIEEIEAILDSTEYDDEKISLEIVRRALKKITLQSMSGSRGFKRDDMTTVVCLFGPRTARAEFNDVDEQQGSNGCMVQ